MIGATTSTALAAIESLVTSGSVGEQAASGNGTGSPTAASDSPGSAPTTDRADTSQDSISISEEALGMFVSSPDGTTMSLGFSRATATETTADGSAEGRQTDEFSLNLSVGAMMPANSGTGGGPVLDGLVIRVDGASGESVYALPTAASAGDAAAEQEQAMIGDALATAAADAQAGAFSISIGGVVAQPGSSGTIELSDALSVSVNAQGVLQATSSHSSVEISNNALAFQGESSSLSVSDEPGNQAVASAAESQTGAWILLPGADGGTTMAYLTQEASLRAGESAGSLASADRPSGGAAAALASMTAFETARRAEEQAPPLVLNGIPATVNAVA